MSTHQPPDGAAGLAQPQDPWEGGFEPGIASVPAPAPPPVRHDPYAGYPPPYPYVVQAPQRSGKGLVIAILVLGILTLGAGGGYAAWYFATQANTGTTTTPTTAASTFDPHQAAVGQCFVNLGTEQQPKIQTSACTVSGSFKILKIKSGTDIKENAKGTFDAETTAKDACAGTGWTFFYGFQDPNGIQTNDVLFCLSKNP